MSFALMMLGGMALDLLLGWPGWLYVRIGHPVTWLGHAITTLERRWNHGARARRLALGALAVALIVALAVLPALAIQSALPDGLTGSLIGAALAWPLIAMRAMHAHVAAVATPLARGDLAAARAAVAMIVGRDPAQLDAAGITRAATESLAENTSDGIIAPLFWGAIAGLPGIAGYKAINTLDSMIGHRNERFEAFGKAAARLDDVVNWLPARLTGALFAIASGRHALRGLRVMRRDAPKHRSPNAGWPEGAMAAALNIRLSGPRVYGTRVAEEPWLNGGAPDPTADDLTRALRLYRRSMALCALALAAVILLRCAA
ncbi:adenosylcobinamide-phosphate synthase CbiB [Salipiger sp. PrR002]|uniref:adenosylcobinamide-phosphate synthase CbiB n=1 Tax=Salipiger sp. PrR002 TaxID=2706489 RepID=UPI0013B6D5EC|nr:adenosylcobinamide-phosphate synthase CbiB [Salipiger sp. PrR002]NDW00344.1 cobalamin biosynthesis protein CobD [Salipiger sp. PrR002]NDW58399.1 cobalamin biosynthesis protein CobD [Salipiger sp. PrR004]